MLVENHNPYYVPSIERMCQLCVEPHAEEWVTLIFLQNTRTDMSALCSCSAMEDSQKWGGGGSFCNAVIFSSVNSKATWNLLKVVPSISSSAPKRVLCPAVVSKFVEDVIQLCSGSLPHYHLQNASEHPDFQEFVGKQVLFFGVSLISWGNS